MITSGFLYGVFALIIAITVPFRLLSDVSMNSGMAGALNSVGGYLSPMDLIFPMGTLLAVLGVFLLYESGYLVYKIMMWIIRRFPTQS
jgi:hypothetical protein